MSSVSSISLFLSHSFSLVLARSHAARNEGLRRPAFVASQPKSARCPLQRRRLPSSRTTHRRRRSSGASLVASRCRRRRRRRHHNHLRRRRPHRRVSSPSNAAECLAVLARARPIVFGRSSVRATSRRSSSSSRSLCALPCRFARSLTRCCCRRRRPLASRTCRASPPVTPRR